MCVWGGRSVCLSACVFIHTYKGHRWLSPVTWNKQRCVLGIHVALNLWQWGGGHMSSGDLMHYRCAIHTRNGPMHEFREQLSSSQDLRIQVDLDPLGLLRLLHLAGVKEEREESLFYPTDCGPGLTCIIAAGTQRTGKIPGWPAAFQGQRAMREKKVPRK